MNDTATEQVRRAWHLRERDLLAHRWADMAVAAAFEQMRHEGREREGDEADRRPRRYAHDVATLATTILIEQLITRDQAIAMLRAERDHYKAIAEQGLKFLPGLAIQTITKPEGEPK
jgi:hypothetical protein